MSVEAQLGAGRCLLREQDLTSGIVVFQLLGECSESGQALLPSLRCSRSGQAPVIPAEVLLFSHSAVSTASMAMQDSPV